MTPNGTPIAYNAGCMGDIPRTARPRIAKKLLFATFAVSILLLLAEGGASLLLALRPGAGERSPSLREELHCDYDADLGWMNKRSFRAENLYGAGVGFTTNSRGFRGTKEVAAEVPAGQRRIVFLGDSFTEGYGVADADCYPAAISAIEPSFEAVNMGLGGFGLDQMFLWYRRDAAELRASVVVLACIAHDFERMGTDHFLHLPKPWLGVDGATLAVRNVPVPKVFGEKDKGRLVRFVRSLALGRAMERLRRTKPPPEDRSLAETPADKIAAEPAWAAPARLVLRDLHALVEARGAKLVFVYLPVRYTVPREPTYGAKFAEETCAAIGIPFWNLSELFGSLPFRDIESYFLPDNHYSARGNRLVAEALVTRLRPML